MNKINFILGVHNHQPVGNFDHVFEEAYQKSYLPLLNALLEFPSIKMMYHTTGPLYDWLESNHSEYFDLVKVLLSREQLEMMTGGYHEPILAIIPDRDKLAQIGKMTRYLETKFGQKPCGMWIAERIWEPHLAKSLAQAGVEFVTLDDYHFFSAGLDPESLLGYYRSDEQGYSLNLFPISKKLRYLIPFAQPEDSLGYLREKADESGNNLLVMADDGEKFGLWPGTHEWIYEKGWLKRFFQALDQAMQEGWLRLTTIAQYSAEHAPRGRVYLPTASYFEMSEWSLPAASGAKFHHIAHEFENQGRMEELTPYLKGGFWRNFLAKYEESNWMYRKMLWVSGKIADLDSCIMVDAPDFSGKLSLAQNHLYRAQCNCAYWHGVFGGLYLPHLRHAIYQNLLAAEELINQIEEVDHQFEELKQLDFDADGSDELYLRNFNVGVILSPRQGGAALELDFLPAHFNLLNTLRRQPEAYHEQVNKAGGEVQEGKSIHDQVRIKEAGLESYLVYDQHPRGALIDHFLSEKESPQSLKAGVYYELGADFVNQPYQVVESLSNRTVIELLRIGKIVDNEVELRKTVALSKDGKGLDIGYAISNRSAIPLTIRLAPEFNFALLAGDYPPDYYYQDDQGLDHTALNSMGVSVGVRRFSLYDKYDKVAIHFQFEAPTEVWRYPVETVSLSEGGFERVFQSSCVLPGWNLNVGKGEEFSVRFKLLMEKLD
jgi:alpha-amylase